MRRPRLAARRRTSAQSTTDHTRSATIDDGPGTVEITSGTVPERDEPAALYGAVGWAAYIKDLDALSRSLRGSSRVVTARSDGRLVGVPRVISDTVTIAYVQDIPVSPEEQRGGVGRRLVTEALAPTPR